MSEITPPAAPVAAVPTRNRFDDALYAQSAPNLGALAHCFADHYHELRSELGDKITREDPALKLIVHQIWSLMGGPTIERDYDAMHHFCQLKAKHHPDKLTAD
jgi:hypothetical protein